MTLLLYSGEIINSQSGYSIHLSDTDDQIFVNDARITSRDIMTGNGVMHAVDRVLISDKGDLFVLLPE